MYPQSKEESSELLRLALPLLARHGSGCQPPSYTVWYEYVQGGNDALDSDGNGSTGRTTCFTLGEGATDLTWDLGLYQTPPPPPLLGKVGDRIWLDTNKDGVQDPVPASHTQSSLSGAPQNDRLDERLGDAVALNTREYVYAGYLQRIRRLVNFYWTQCVDNLPNSVRFAKTNYTTAVASVLDAQGALDTIDVTMESGSSELDGCVVQAFKVAGPFPNPPEGLIEKDGRVYLPDMSFEVNLGLAQMQYQGVDPRAGVMFPGILKSPR